MRHALLASSVLAAPLVAGLLLSVLGSAARAEAPFAFDRAPGQLPKDVVPDAYRIDVAVDLDHLTLAGSETIEIEVRKPVASAMLNQAGLTLTSATTEAGAAATIAQDEKAQTATLTFAQPLAAGRHRLTIAYTGPIPNTPAGIYYNDYKTGTGAVRRMLVTQFEVADARRMFPGWDEPAFKATFQLAITLPEALRAVSNMPVTAEQPAGPGRKRVAFANSPRMSTYLLAVVAGDFAALHDKAGETDLTLWAPAGTQANGAYALAAEKQILPFYNDYFGVPYPLPKLDLIAIPGNYAAGAMENWGAITFIDSTLLFDPRRSSPSTKETVFLDVAHEMAHQWSGDLVTMGWWDNIWLNEGFATWMEEKATDHFNPSWEVWPRQHEQRERAMAQDAQPTTHAIQQTIHDISEANSAFDQISYQKGEQVIRMVEDWLGPAVFRDGMRAYMKAHAYHNATSADLWAALGRAAGRDVAGVAATFTEQPGIPLVHVARACDGGRGQITLTQDRFTIHDPHPAALGWKIPVTAGAPGGSAAEAAHVLLGAAPAILPLAACGAAVKVNFGEDGYYRTQYDEASLRALAPAMPSLSAADRANLLGDQFALFVAGRAPLTDWLNLLPAMASERSNAVWVDTLVHLHRLYDALAGSPLRDAFDAFAVRLIRPEFDRLGWDAKAGESFLDSLLRPDIIASLGRYGDAGITEEAGRRFHAFLANAASLDPALRDPVFGIVGHHADQATFDTLRTLGVKATSTEEKLTYFEAMASAADPKLIEQTVAFADSGEVPNGRIAGYLAGASSATGSPDLLYRLVVPHEAALERRMPPGIGAPSALVAAAAGSSDPATAQAMLADPSSSASAGDHIWAARVAGAIEATAELRTRAQPALADFLKTAVR